jgi:SAM-dependent methyltransferase
MVRKLINIYRKHQAKKAQKLKALERELFIQNGQIPWSLGYWEYRNEQIAKSISNTEIVRLFRQGQVPKQFGYKLDERLVEYCWIFSQLPQEKIKLLDAGSTFNHDFIINNLDFSKIELSILTYAPEYPNFNEKRISYIYADLRDIPLKDESYDVIISQSTIEHIDMDNSMYGYDIQHHKEEKAKSYEYLKAVAEMFRVLKQGGKLLLTFPYGKFENHGFFQQFDEEMLNRILSFFDKKGTFTTSFFRYLPDGWIACEKEDCKDVESFNPHTGRGKGTDGAAHCRSICCISFQKNK